MSKVGIMGGTFNPIHLAHTEMAKVCLRQQDLDKILFMPSKNPPHKKDKSILPENERAVMESWRFQNMINLYFRILSCKEKVRHIRQIH